MNKRLVIFLLVFVLIGIYGFNSSYAYKGRTSLRNYNNYVKTKRKSNLYKIIDDKYVSIGYINKNIELELNDYKDDYYNIKNTNFYIYYTDVTKIDNYKKTEYNSILKNGKIRSFPTILYNGNNLVYKLNEEMEFDILGKNKDEYYVYYLNDIYTIKNNYNVEESNIKGLDKISVIRFNCNGDIEDSFINYLRENKYNFINEEEFKLWKKGYSELKEKSIYVISNDNEKYIIGDRQTTRDSVTYFYQVINDTKMDRFIEMVNGVPLEKAESIPVMNYHFFYDNTSEVCNESICLDIKKFKEELDYLIKNNYYFLDTYELNDWLDGKIELPKKSILLTIDDGAMGTDTHLINILNEYKVKATLFMITGWFNHKNFESNYLDIASHGNDLHYDQYYLDNKTGYKGLMIDKFSLDKDIKDSLNLVKNKISFCFPFYRYNSNFIEVLKENGIKLAFIGGNNKVTRNSDKYKLPRYVIQKNTSLRDFINMIN